MKTFNPATVSRDQWATMLTFVITDGLRNNPGLLFDMVANGKRQFVKNGLMTDRYGLRAAEYEEVFARLARVATRWGYKTH